MTIAILNLMLLLTGMGRFTVGVVPGWEEVGRLVVYRIVSTAHVSFWLGLAILLSSLFRSPAISALAVVALYY